MRSLVSAVIIFVICFSFTGCANPRVINGKTYEPYGIANKDAKKDPSVKYEIPLGNAVVGILFVESVFVPVYIIGWDLYEPVGLKADADGKK